jgi:V-type H+-transporting ATPase subunit H
MAETNPIEYTLADSRDASMYARVLLKLLAEAASAGAGHGQVSNIHEVCNEEKALQALSEDPLGVVSHYAITKLHNILTTLLSGSTGVTVSTVFYVGKDGVLVDQWKALLRILNKASSSSASGSLSTRTGDMFAQSGAALCLALILVTACPSMQKSTTTTNAANKEIKTRSTSYASAVEPLEALTAWVVSQLKVATGNAVGVAIPAMLALMTATETRHLFSASGGIKHLAAQLRSKGRHTPATTATATTTNASGNTTETKKTGNTTIQQLYELTFCLWCMTYELNTSPSIRADFMYEGAAIQALCDMVSSAPREKVVRVALSALRNLATCSAAENPGLPGTPTIDGSTFLADMLACRLLKSVHHLQDRQFTDPDIVEDIKALHKLLSDNYKEMSRWEVYKNEVESGHLQWGSTHTEAFFKENAMMMEGKDSDFRLLKVLIALLSSKDDEIAAIACHDIGEFVRFYPNGKAIAKRLGAKELVMHLIEHDNVDLQRHALQCVSKMMVQKWEYVK